jgi:hypothetical protein
MNNDRKIIIFFISIPLAVILIIFLISKVKFDLSISPLEKKLFNFNYESTPKIIERIPAPQKSIKSPIVISKLPERGFPDVPLISITPPLSGADIKVSLIFVNRNKKMTIIDGKLLQEGDVFDHHRIARIEKDKVLLKNKEGEKWLKLE